MAKPALGRGLGALLGGVSAPFKQAAPATASVSPAAPAFSLEPSEQVRRVALERIRPGASQPRKEFASEALRELADSIKEQGIIQPLVVRQRDEHFELIAGERRWRAAQLLGLKEIPVLVREADDRSVLELALIENLQRENLNPLEEASGYAELIEKFHLGQEEVAGKVGKSRAVVANALRLLKLPPTVQNYLRDGRLSVGHAKVILGLSGAVEQGLAAERIIKHALNVRQAEELVAHLQKAKAGRGAMSRGESSPADRDPHVADLENRLRERLATKVRLRYRQGAGALDIRFFNDEELERILQIMGVKVS